MRSPRPRTKGRAAGTAGAPWGEGEEPSREPGAVTRSLPHARAAPALRTTGARVQAGPEPARQPKAVRGTGMAPARPNPERGRRVTSAWRFRRKNPRLLLLLRRRSPWSPGCSRRRRSPQTWRRRRRERPESGAKEAAGGPQRREPGRAAGDERPPEERAAAASSAPHGCWRQLRTRRRQRARGHRPRSLRAPAAMHHGMTAVPRRPPALKATATRGAAAAPGAGLRA